MVAKQSWVQDLVDRSFFGLSTNNRPLEVGPSAITPVIKDDQFRERFLREMAGIDPPPRVQVKADLGNELEVVDERGACFYVKTNGFCQH